MKPIKAWWFEPVDGKLRFNDGRKPRKGRTHKVKGPPILCEHGLHASVRLIDAIYHANSNVVWLVELSGETVEGKDKIAATERTYIQRVDIETELRAAARRFALDVVHMWAAPPVVVEFLKTGDETLRAAAWSSAGAAAWSVARAAGAAGAAVRADAGADAQKKQNQILTRLVMKRLPTLHVRQTDG